MPTCPSYSHSNPHTQTHKHSIPPTLLAPRVLLLLLLWCFSPACLHLPHPPRDLLPPPSLPPSHRKTHTKAANAGTPFQPPLPIRPLCCSIELWAPLSIFTDSHTLLSAFVIHIYLFSFHLRPISLPPLHHHQIGRTHASTGPFVPVAFVDHSYDNRPPHPPLPLLQPHVVVLF